MSAISKIQWTDRTWNPVRGCALVSEGCRNCYAMKQAHRFSGKGQAYEGLTKLGPSGPRWTGKIRTVEEALDEPLHWRKPARVFVNSMSDLFHEDVPMGFVMQVFAIMAIARQHTFQILTKRPESMRETLTASGVQGWVTASLLKMGPELYGQGNWSKTEWSDPRYVWPLPNVWLGISVEDQKTADERILKLLNVPAARRFVSYEPALGPVNFAWTIPVTHENDQNYKGEIRAVDYLRGDPRIDWVIVGGESGPGARPFNLQWARDTIAQCKAAGVACFVKQLGAYIQWNGIQGGYGNGPSNVWPNRPHKEHDGNLWRVELNDRKGGDLDEWPEDIRIREFPR